MEEPYRSLPTFTRHQTYDETCSLGVSSMRTRAAESSRWSRTLSVTGLPASASAAWNGLGGGPATAGTYRSPSGRVVSTTSKRLRRRAVETRSTNFLRFFQTQLVTAVLAISTPTGRSNLNDLLDVMADTYPFAFRPKPDAGLWSSYGRSDGPRRRQVPLGNAPSSTAPMRTRFSATTSSPTISHILRI